MAFDKQLLDILACPVCKGKLRYLHEQNVLLCRFDRLLYPIRDNIPVLLESEATQISGDELEKMDK